MSVNGTKRHLAATQHSVAFGSKADMLPRSSIYDGMQAMTPSNNTSNYQRTRSIDREGIIDECNTQSFRESCSFDTADEVIMRLVLFLLEPQGLGSTLFIEIRPVKEHYIVIDAGSAMSLLAHKINQSAHWLLTSSAHQLAV